MIPAYLKPLFKTYIKKYAFTNPRNIAAFLATLDHESNGFKRIEENLNYSEERLCQVWPKRFPKGSVAIKQCSRNPQVLANFVYGNRMGNIHNGDGYLFRGRGYIQLTGRSNYELYSKLLNMPLDKFINYIITPEGALHTACEFWVKNDLHNIENFETICKRVNGGLTDYNKRVALFTQYMSSGI